MATLTRTDVKGAMEEILSYHVETRAVSPEVMQRALKIFVTKFDPGKVYLLQDEISPFLNMTRNELKKMVSDYHQNDVNTFLALSLVIEASISRAANLRERGIRELTVQTLPLKLPKIETYLTYARSERELSKRIKNELTRFLVLNDKNISPKTPVEKEKSLTFFDKKVKRQEKGYGSDEHHLVVHTLKAMAQGLDSHTSYYTPQEAQEMRTMLVKEFKGVGVVFQEDPDGVTIVSLLKGGPAERSGKIQSGDRLEAINTYSVHEITYEELLEKMKKETSVTLHVRHASGTRDQVTLTKERIELADERVKACSTPFGEGIIGKIDLPSFYGSPGGATVEKDMIQALRNLKKQGKLVGLVIDMRENAGGFLSEAVKVASLFVKSGVIVVSKYGRGEIEYLRDINPAVHYDGPLLLLTSQASASAAEILAQALQDYGLALVAGDPRTFGKGSIQYQTLTDPNAKNFFKVTIGRYYTVSGRSTQITGVRADIVVPTQYSVLKLGERYLDYPLANDQIDSAYLDPLRDIQDAARPWFQRYYLPNLQQRTSYWRQMIPALEKNSARRIANNPNYQLFLKFIKKEPTQGNFGKADLQMEEALDILRDMITLHQEKQTTNSLH